MTGEILLLFSVPGVVSVLGLVACLLAPDLVRTYLQNVLSYLVLVAFVVAGVYGGGLLAWNLSGSGLWVAVAVLIGATLGLQLANLVNRFLLYLLYR